MNKKNSMELAVTTSLWSVFTYVSSLFKVSFVFGSYVTFFYATNIVAPLSGAFGGTLGSVGVFGVRALIRLLFGAVLSFKFLAFHVPGFCASLYWAHKGPVIRLFLPLACMALFIAHPVGGAAYVYALLWLIPVGLYFVPNKHNFLVALGSTFTAHAVGSVIWLYATPMTSVFWISLLPVALVERFCFALGMSLLYQMIVIGRGIIPRMLKKVSVSPMLVKVGQYK